MDFGLSEEQQAIIETTRAFVENELYPHEAMVERTGHVPMELISIQRSITAGDNHHLCLAGCPHYGRRNVLVSSGSITIPAFASRSSAASSSFTAPFLDQVAGGLNPRFFKNVCSISVSLHKFICVNRPSARLLGIDQGCDELPTMQRVEIH